jgi:hypothetical protein
MVYEVGELGVVIRCPGCDNALIRLAHNRGRYLVHLGEHNTSRPGNPSEESSGMPRLRL